MPMMPPMTPPATPKPMPQPTHAGMPPKGGPMAKPPGAPMKPDAAAHGMAPADVGAKIEAQLPEPEKGYYTYALVDKLAKATNDALHKVLAHHHPDGAFPEVTCPQDNVKAGRLMGKLPLPVVAPALLLVDVVVSTAGPAGQRYATDLAELGTDDGVRDLTAKMKMLGSDKAVQKAIDSHMAAPPHAEPDGDEVNGAEPPGPEEIKPPPAATAYMG